MKSCPDCQRKVEDKDLSCSCGYDFPTSKPIPAYRTSLVVSAPSPKDSEYIKDARAVFAKAGKISGFDLAELMFDMETKYPGKGWRNNACQVLMSFNDKAGIATDKDLLTELPVGIKAQPCAVPGCRNPGNNSAYVNKSTHWFCSDHLK